MALLVIYEEVQDRHNSFSITQLKTRFYPGLKPSLK
ncbi:hypothetical protein POX_a00718 [Penicillium oxalicum]|nr:hypothetical protein POX_a00718 [Penicillium oxalicum]KAI2794128.1 hypothetical protein POX_a00718 [Penicillium oxalicum]